MLAAIQMYCVKSSVPLYRRLTASCRMTVACMAKISPVIVESTKDVREMILDQFDVFIFGATKMLHFLDGFCRYGRRVVAHRRSH